MANTSVWRHGRLSLCVSFALLAPVASFAGKVSGPGNSHTVNAGDAAEFWSVDDNATLIIQPGGALSGVDAYASVVNGYSMNLRSSLTGFLLIDRSSGQLSGGEIYQAITTPGRARPV